MPNPFILDLGCGPRKAPGSIGLDAYPFPGVDIVRDLRRGLPFSDSVVDGIIARHVLEHFGGDNLLFLVDEMWRVCRHEAHWHLEMPDAFSPNRYKDPTHLTRDWSEDSFALWEVNVEGQWPIYVGPAYGRHAKLRRVATYVTDSRQRNRVYEMEVVKP